MKVKIDKKQDFYYQAECNLNFYICQYCEYDHVIEDDKYCSNCGNEIEWVEDTNL